MDRFVVGDAVAEIVEMLHPVVHVGSYPVGVSRGRVVGERRCEGWHPQVPQSSLQ